MNTRTMSHTSDPSNGTRGRKRIDPLTRYVVAPDGCWHWQGYVGKNGYGQCWTGPAHRHFYRKMVGEIPEGMHVDHLCHNPAECTAGSDCSHRRCVNPAHLAVVTPRENVLRSNSLTARYAAATHCSRGHRFVGDNLRFKGGSRVCATCDRRRVQEVHQRERERVASAGDLSDPELRVLLALRKPLTDLEVSFEVGVTRQMVSQRRAALVRGGLVERAGRRSIAPGVASATVWLAK